MAFKHHNGLNTCSIVNPCPPYSYFIIHGTYRNLLSVIPYASHIIAASALSWRSLCANISTSSHTNQPSNFLTSGCISGSNELKIIYFLTDYFRKCSYRSSLFFVWTASSFVFGLPSLLLQSVNLSSNSITTYHQPRYLWRLLSIHTYLS